MADYREVRSSSHHLETHPDGQPWKKCCRGMATPLGDSPTTFNCAYVDKRLRKSNPTTNPFVCIHRTQDGKHRVCAGWHACHGRNWENDAVIESERERRTNVQNRRGS
jgi:hypothetical protein